MHLVLLTVMGDSSSGIGALGFSGQAFLIQLITFILAYLVLRRYAFGPIIRLMRQRRATIDDSVKLAAKLRQEQTELDQKVDKILHEASQKADSIIAEAQEAVRQASRDSDDKARTKAAAILAEAEERLKLESNQARKTLEKEVVGLISEVTEAVIEQKLDTKKDLQLIEKALKERQVA